jgi:hypothetical protein
MGSYAFLQLGNLEVDWGKNDFYFDHGELFQSSDIIDRATGDINEKIAFQKTLRDVATRLQLLGHSLKSVQYRHESALVKNDYDIEDKFLCFESVKEAFGGLDVGAVPAGYRNYIDDDAWEIVTDRIIEREAVSDPEDVRLVKAHLSDVFSDFNPRDILALLAQNPANLDIPLVWNFDDIIQGGWAIEEEFDTEAQPKNRYLIVTEGNSDSLVIRKAFELLRPDIDDFFYFIDMEENYPFTGVGNLHNFVQGLTKINIQNRTIIIYDNDAEGSAKYSESAALSLPDNMQVIKVPDLEDFKDFETIGPSGQARDDINGRAVAIECFLDLNFSHKENPRVRWTTFNNRNQQYQGELENKVKYFKEFMRIEEVGSYNIDKLQKLLDEITKTAVDIADHEAEKESTIL